MAQITFDGSSSSGYQAGKSSYSWVSHSITVNKPSIFIVQVALFVSGSVSSVTLNNINLSFLRVRTNGAYKIMTYYLTQPPTGMNLVTVTLSGSLTSTASEVVYYNVSATSPFIDQEDNTGTGNPASVTAAPLTSNPMIVGGLVTATASGITENSNVGQTSRQLVNGALGTLDVSDIFDTALQFDGSQNYVSLGTMGNWASGKPSFYISLQMKANSASAGSYRKLLYVGGLFDWGIDTNGHPFFEFHTVNNDYNPGIYYTSASLYDNAIHTLTINWDGNNVNFYIDNTLVHTGSGYTDASGLATASDVYILAYNKGNGSEFFWGTLDNFQIGTSSSQLYGSYAMNEGSGTTLFDKSGQGNNGTLEQGAGAYPSWVAGLSSSEQLLWNGLGGSDTWASTGLTLNESTTIPTIYPTGYIPISSPSPTIHVVNNISGY